MNDCVICFCVFFFQAEDGIRDLTVTGVQTCALPIYVSYTMSQCHHRILSLSFNVSILFGSIRANMNHTCQLMLYSTLARSEERRVGKECRSRWSPYH